MEGFGEKSYDNLIESIEKAKQIPLANLLYSLGIKGIGLSMAKTYCRKISVSDYKDAGNNRRRPA